MNDKILLNTAMTKGNNLNKYSTIKHNNMSIENLWSIVVLIVIV